MWIDALYGLLLVSHVYSQADKHNKMRKRTSAIGIRGLLHFGLFLRWIERKEVRDKTWNWQYYCTVVSSVDWPCHGVISTICHPLVYWV